MDISLTLEIEQRQQDEIDSIASIYGDIFKDITPQGLVWNRKPSPHYQVTLIADNDPERPELSLILDIELTKTYPISPPIVNLLEPKNLLKARIKELNDLVENLIQEYPQQEVSFTIISEVKDKLDEFQQHTERVLSLEEEREQRIKSEQEKLLKLEAIKEQELQLSQQRQSDELNKQIQKIQGEYVNVNEELEIVDQSEVAMPENVSDYFVFENDITASINRAKYIFRFRAVKSVGKYDGKDLLSSIAKQTIVEPYLSQSVSDKFAKRNISPVFLLSEIDFFGSFWLTDTGRKEIQALERDLESVLGNLHPNIISMYGFHLNKIANKGWKVAVISEYNESAVSMEEVLENQSKIDLAMARAWLIQILPALELLHNAGTLFKLITPLSLFLCDLNEELYEENETNATQVLKLAHPTVGYQLMSMYHTNVNSSKHQIDYSFLSSHCPSEWIPPELQKHTKNFQKKTDVWQLALIFMKIILGPSCLTDRFPDPNEFNQKVANNDTEDSLNASEDAYDMLNKMLQKKLSKRPSFLELNAIKFLRDGPVLSTDYRYRNGRFVDAATLHNMDNLMYDPDTNHLNNDTEDLANKGPIGRYEREFEEIGKLGKGGFGEVVKVRNRMEGTFYAIKKIKHRTHKLDSLLSEVLSLARLNHQYIVRYYGTWVEELQDDNSTVRGQENEQEEEDDDSDFDDTDIVRSSTSQLNNPDSFQVDFISNSFDPNITFGSVESDDDDDEYEFEFGSRSGDYDEHSTETDKPLSKAKPKSQKNKMSMLYIQMEFCENNTLLNLIEQGLPNNSSEYWRLFRQLLEAVSYIHREGFIHRDLKPMNIFIDKSNNIKVGDFGLAKNSQFSSALLNNNQVSSSNDKDFSTVVGTLFYNAKEVATGNYDEKVDMYSLGIIFFEMCYSLATGMERAQKINNLRLESIKFPPDFSESKNRLETKIIKLLLDHNPSKRPSASELLQSGWMPVEHQDQVIKEALKSLADPASPWQQQVRETLFNQPYLLARDLMFDNKNRKLTKQHMEYNVGDYLLFRGMVDSLFKIFKKHGAVEEFNSEIFLPKPPSFSRQYVYEVLDRNGSVLSLPYDLVLPFARFLSRNTITIPKIFRHDFVFRPNVRGVGAPDKFSVVSFDIISNNNLDNYLHDAECIKVVDEILNSFSCFDISSASRIIMINHYDIIDAILTFTFRNVGIDEKSKLEIMEILSQLNVDREREDIKKYLREEYKVPQTVTNDLIDMFDFTIEPEKAKSKLQRLLVDSPLLLKVERSVKYITNVLAILSSLGVKTEVRFNPLASYNSKYYTGSIMFQALFKVDKTRKLSRVATGGRYDNLTKNLSDTGLSKRNRNYAVGFLLSTTYLFLMLKNYEKKIAIDRNRKWRNGRCEVLVTTLNRDILIDCGLDIIRDLWDHDISCDLYLASSQEDYLDKADFEGIPWVVLIRLSNSSIKKKLKKSNTLYKTLRVRDMEKNKDTDVDNEELLTHISQAIQTRKEEDQGENRLKEDLASESKDEFVLGDSPLFSVDINQKALVVSNEAPRGRKNNKSNKWEQENDSIIASANLIRTLASSLVISIDVNEDMLNAILTTSLHSQDLWIRKMYSSSSNTPRTFVTSIYNTLIKERSKGSRWVMLYSSKTGTTTVVDLER